MTSTTAHHNGFTTKPFTAKPVTAEPYDNEPYHTEPYHTEPDDTEHFDTDVLVLGAGPVGLTLANLLGGYGISTVLADAGEKLIDYPRGVGLDDESLRTFQTAGVVDQVLPHTTPQHIMRMVNGTGQVLANVAPGAQDYGWSRRNGFIQPAVDAELFAALSRFDNVD